MGEIDWRTYKPPVYCRSKGGSDYCQWCGRDMFDKSPCEPLELARLAMIPDDEVVAFGCHLASAAVEYGEPPEPC